MSARAVLLTVLSVIAIGLISPIIGYFLEQCIPNKLMFSRSGCVMVACSVTVIYLNHFVSASAEKYRELSEAIKKLPPDFLEKNPNYLDSLSPEAKDAFSHMPLEALVKGGSAAKKLSSGLERLSSKAFIAVEFFAGILGTLIWGFGDFVLFKNVVFGLLLVVYLVVLIIYLRFIYPKRWYEA